MLFTNLESQDNFPEFGTSLLYTLRRGVSLIDQLALRQLFSAASYSVVNTLKAYQNSTDLVLPADERIASAQLTNLTLSGSAVSFEVTITTDAGSSVAFVVPLPK
jgi:hypothetical protein